MEYYNFTQSKCKRQGINSYHVVDSDDQEQMKYNNKKDISTSFKKQAQSICNPQVSTLKIRLESEAPQINIKQIIMQTKINQLKKVYYQRNNQTQQKLTGSVHEQLLKRAIQSSEKECQQIQHMINQLLRDQRQIQLKIKEKQKKRRMLSRMTPQIYQMQTKLKESISIKLCKNIKLTNNQLGKVAHPKFSKSKNNLQQTIDLKRHAICEEAQNQIKTKPNSPLSKIKTSSNIKNKLLKEQNSTIRKKRMQGSQLKPKLKKPHK